MLPILACFAGIYVGLHFTILALLPLSILGAGAYVVSACANGQGWLEALAAVALPIVTVQVGYFLGLTTRPAYHHLRSRLNLGHTERI